MRELLIVSVVLLWTAASGDVNLAEFLGWAPPSCCRSHSASPSADGVGGSSGASRAHRAASRPQHCAGGLPGSRSAPCDAARLSGAPAWNRR